MRIVWKVLTVISALFVISAISETNRIMTSNDADIAGNRPFLTAMAVAVTLIIAVLTIVFWRLGYKKKIRK